MAKITNSDQFETQIGITIRRNHEQTRTPGHTGVGETPAVSTISRSGKRYEP
jgi:hypothetical protein